jgi:uncharacterized membrane protein
MLVLPFLAPLLLSRGQTELANFIYDAYSFTCHEWPFRAYFLFGRQVTYSADELQAAGLSSIYHFRGSPELGYKVAFCARNVAIYGGALLGGLLFATTAGRRLQLSFGSYLLLIAPMALDGFTQLPGWRESTWELRTMTGLLFGLASALLIYPRLASVLEEISQRRAAQPGRDVVVR